MKGYLANRSDMKVGTKVLQAGMPFPPSQVTASLLNVGHVREVDTDGEEYRAAVATHGKPPQGPIPSSGAWEYERAKAPAMRKAPSTPKAKAPAKAPRSRKAAPARKGRGR